MLLELGWAEGDRDFVSPPERCCTLARFEKETDGDIRYVDQKDTEDQKMMERWRR